VDPIVRDGFLAVQGLECIHKLAYCAELVTLLEAVLGASVFVYPKKPIRLIWPNQSALRHQDFPFFQGSVDALTAWVPLGECPTTMGGLRVLPGSHRLGVLPHSEKGPGLALRGNLPGGWATADFRPGDVVIFHHFLIHDASPNRSDRFRVSVDFRYQPYGDPVCRPGLQPLYQSEGWREVTRHWSSRRWVALPDDPAAVVRKEWVPPAQAHTLELPASRFAGGTRVQKRSRP
jgi:ectoine hydroxylase-related dioxygenase (phytanoyl-CoA dioxygenase family)